MRRITWPTLAALVLLMTLYLTRPSAATVPQLTPTPSRTVVPPTTPVIVNVNIINYGYDPQQINVPVGGTVVWRNSDADPHTATGDAGEWDTGELEQGQTANFTFVSAGTYSYFCTVHPEMGGIVTVVGPATATPTPTSGVPTTTATPTGGTPTSTATATATSIATATFEPTATTPIGPIERYLPRLMGRPAQVIVTLTAGGDH
jgi:plastocyanin